MKSRLLNLPTPIVTPRLYIRPPTIGDGKLLNQAVIESFNTLRTYMEWAQEKPTIDDSEEVVRREAANWMLKNKSDPELMLLILDRNTQDLIGASGYHQIDWDLPSVETGYWIRDKYRGQGLMTEAINAITQYAFHVLEVKRIAITCDVDNLKSKKIPERLGYYLEGTLKNHRRKPITKEITDTLIYARYDLSGLPGLVVKWGNSREKELHDE